MPELRKILESSEFNDLVQVAIFLGFLNGKRIETCNGHIWCKSQKITANDN
jgi:hypothetical protein